MFGHGGGDTFDIGTPSTDASVDGLEHIYGDILVNGVGGSGDQLNGKDHHGNAESYTFDADVLSLTNTNITHNGVESIDLFATSENDTIHVNSISGVNFLTVAARSGADSVHLGTEVNGNLADIEASITVRGSSLGTESGRCVLHLHDQLGIAGDYRFGLTTVINDATGQSIKYHLFDELTLDATNHDDTITVGSVTGIDLQINGRLGNDTFQIGQDGGGNLALMRADLTIQGSFGNDQLVINDRSGNGNAVHTLSSLALQSTRTWFGSLTFYSMTDVALHGSDWNDTVNLTSTGAFSPYDFAMWGYAGDDTLSLGSNGSLNSITAAVTYFAGIGNDTLNLDDVLDGTAHEYEVDFSQVQRDGELLITFFQTEMVNLTGGELDDQFIVNGVSGPTDIAITGGSGQTNVDIGAAWQDFDSSIAGNISVNGVATVQIFDSLDAGDDSYVMSDNSFHKPGAGGSVVYDAGSDVRLWANDGHNTIDITAVDSSLSFTVYAGDGNDIVNGGGGNDTIYGQAGNDTISGGAGNDILLGNDGTDTLQGQAGRDILIGGRHEDTLLGGGGQDIVIGSTTDFDKDEAAIQAIMAEWSSNRNHRDRVRNLSGIQNKKFEDRLNGDNFLQRKTTVGNDSAADQVFGEQGRDWLFSSPLDDLDDTPIDTVA